MCYFLREVLVLANRAKDQFHKFVCGGVNSLSFLVEVLVHHWFNCLTHYERQCCVYNYLDVPVCTEPWTDCIVGVLHQFVSFPELTRDVWWKILSNTELNELFLRSQYDVSQFSEVFDYYAWVVIVYEEKLSGKTLKHAVIVHKLFKQWV